MARHAMKITIAKKKPAIKSDFTQWRVVTDFPEHEISSIGQIRRKVGTTIKAEGELLTPNPRGRHLYINLAKKIDKYAYDDRAILSIKVPIAALELEAFGISRPSKEHHIAYRDGNKFNLDISNIAWAKGTELIKFNRKATLKKRGPTAYDRIPICVDILRFVFYTYNSRKLTRLSEVKFSKTNIDVWTKYTVKDYKIKDALVYLVAKDIIQRDYDSQTGRAFSYCILPKYASEGEVWEVLANFDCMALAQYDIDPDYGDTRALSLLNLVADNEEDSELKEEIVNKIEEKPLKKRITRPKAYNFDVEDEFSSENVEKFLTINELEQVFEEDE